MSGALTCRTPGRRGEVVARGRNGLDAIDVSDDQLTLRAHLLAAPPRGAAIGVGDVRVEGGRTIRDIRVVDVQLVRSDDDADPCLLVRVDRPGDFSTYVLRVDDAGFDPRFAALPFSFKVGCRVDTDCAPEAPYEPPAYPEPELSYLAKDYESFRALLLGRMAVVLPEWRERHVPDLQLALVELLAYAGDELSQFQDAVATEAYLDTAHRRISVRRHARLVDYAMHDGCNARAWVCVEVAGDVRVRAGDAAFVAAAETLGVPAPLLPCERLEDLPAGAAQVYEPLEPRELRLREELNRIRFWTWGDQECCLEAGATAATLRGHPPLGAGDVLILEEVLGPRTGVAADADPSRRQAVRVTAVAAGQDPLYSQRVLEVRWDRADALRFPLCLSAAVGEDCRPVEDLSVARGNVVLVDHGATVGWCDRADEELDPPVGVPQDPVCAGPCEPVAVPDRIGRYAPRLARWPVTQRSLFPPPEARAARQRELLAPLPDRARDVLDRVLDAVERGERPDDGDLAILGGPLGAAALADAGLPDDPDPDALRSLSARFTRLIAPALRRLGMIRERLLAGRPLAPVVVEELAERWGALVDPAELGGASAHGAASTAFEQDPRRALPAVELTSTPPDGSAPVEWTVRRDLLGSDAHDAHVVGEVDDDGAVVLRFGAATGLGRAPLPGEAMRARYRVGNGTAGNVPTEAISRIVLRSARTQAIARVRNPLPAAGGIDPELPVEVKLLAPGAARREQLRAVTAADYAALAARVPGVDAATARLRWTGGWYEASVGVDGAADAPPSLLAAVEARLSAARRLGHDLAVRPAPTVPIKLELTVCLLPAALRAQVRDALMDLLGDRALSGGRRGLFHPDELEPGEPIRVSVIVAAVQAVPGVETVEVTGLRPLGSAAAERVPASGVLTLGPLEVAQLANDPSQPDLGRVVLDLRGGR